MEGSLIVAEVSFCLLFAFNFNIQIWIQNIKKIKAFN